MFNQFINLSATPRGCLTLLPVKAKKKRYLENILLERMGKWGYEEVVTPIFEYLDIISPAISDDLLKSAYKLIDRQSGRIMLLRPDVTPQIAKISATALKDNIMPLRLCYSLNIFRYEEEHGGKQKELYQIGAELIGIDGNKIEADIEIISMIIDLMEVAQLKEYYIIISHKDFIDGIIEQIIKQIDISEKNTIKQELKKIFLYKNIYKIEKFCIKNKLNKKICKMLKEIIFLYGNVSILDKALSFSLNDISKKAIEELKKIYKCLENFNNIEKISFDLSETKGFEYHTGVMFEVLCPLKQPIGYGGRYDTMIEKFGTKLAATGFSIDLIQLLNISSYSNEHENSVYIVDFTDEKINAFKLAKRLREKGFTVVIDILKRNFQESIQYANSHRYKFIVKIVKKNEIYLTSTKDYSNYVICNSEEEVLHKINYD